MLALEGSVRLNSTLKPSQMGSRNEGSYLTGSARKGIHKENSVGNFIPLRDLLKKNHEDRVKDYLNEME